MSVLFCSSITIGADQLDQAISKHRMGTLIIEGPAGAEVDVKQLRHSFWFGAALANQMFSGSKNSPSAEKYKSVFLENFNAAVTENALKWPSMQRTRDRIDYSVVDAMLRWTEEHEIPLRGHNVFWGVQKFVQDWVQELDDAELKETLRQRALTIAKRYRGRFAEYDLNNEMLHDNFYERRLGPNITKEMADWFREGDPNAVLYLNDYDILTGNRLNDYVKQINDFLGQGVAIGGIGVQGHLHGDSFDPVKLKHSLEALGKLNLPIRITEFNLPGQRSTFHRQRQSSMTAEQEQAKAKAIVEYYRICFANPNVDGILMWGFWESACWIPASALFKKDWTPTPAALAYRDLVYRQWWTDESTKFDEHGKTNVRVFYGKHRVRCGNVETIVEITPKDRVLTVQL
ncbi:endo-1,4-beta-xylanase [Novipirellula herctigrandis]